MSLVDIVNRLVKDDEELICLSLDNREATIKDKRTGQLRILAHLKRLTTHVFKINIGDIEIQVNFYLKDVEIESVKKLIDLSRRIYMMLAELRDEEVDSDGEQNV